MTFKEQIDEWTKGNSIHNKERDICCPDFSCCCSEISTDKALKIKFKLAYENKEKLIVNFLLMVFLVNYMGKKIKRRDKCQKLIGYVSGIANN